MYGSNHFAPGGSFYHQYMQHHAQLTQWFNQLQHTIDPNRGAHFCNGGYARPSHTCCNSRGRPAFRGPRHCCSAPARPACCAAQPCCPSNQMRNQHARALPQDYYPPEQMLQYHGRHIPRNIRPSRRGMALTSAGRPSGRIGQPHGPIIGRVRRQAQGPLAFVEKREEESEDSSEDEKPEDSAEEEEGNSSSDDELVCDVDAFVAILDKKDDSDKASEDSFELVDSVEDEKFKYEYIELDEYGIMQRRYGKRREVNKMQDELLKKQQREYLYGERADAICGLETLMGINFDHFSDMNQPVLWPVLPLSL